MDLVALATVLGVLAVKEAGVPIPIPGDLLVITAGVAASGLGPAAVLVLAAILIAGYVGGTVQFILVRGVLRDRLLGLLARFGVHRARLDGLAARLARHGARGVAVARMTPGVRVGAIAASGLAALPLPVFVGGLAAGNAVFVGGHFLLGFAIGMPALDLIRASGGIVAGVAVLVVLGIAGAVAWTLIRRRRSGSATPQPLPTDDAPLAESGRAARRRGDGWGDAAWADAACPACLTVAAISALRR